MTFARIYETWEVRDLMKNSEGQPSPVTNKGAHARTLHATQTTTGKHSEFTTRMHDRTHKRIGETNKIWKNRGGTPKTSAFDNLLFQSAAVTQAFNSPTGQNGFAVFDDPANSGKSLRMTLTVAGVEEYTGTNQGPKMRSSDKNTATVTATPGAAGVAIIVDKGPATTAPFIQTCYPLDVCPGSSYKVEDMTSKSIVSQG